MQSKFHINYIDLPRWLLLVLMFCAGHVWSFDEERLRLRLEYFDEQPSESRPLPLVNPLEVNQLYQRVNFRPLWILEDNGKPNDRAHYLVTQIENVWMHGLNSEDYHLSLILQKMDRPAGEDRLSDGRSIDLELLLSDAAMLLAHHLKHGKVDSETLEIKPFNDAELISELANIGREKDLADWLENKIPTGSVYKSMVKELVRLRSRNKPDAIQLSGAIKLNQEHPDIFTIRKILREFEYLTETENDSPKYDSVTFAAVKKFQQEHSLEDDGVIGVNTRAALVALVNGDREKLRVNMERWRWLPETLGRNYISVNIASFNLRYIYDGKEQLRMKTIVGRNYRKSPIFSADMTYVVVNPSWSVPYTIASQDLLPKIQANSQFLADMGMVVYEGWGESQKVVDPAAVNWQALTPKRFPYHIRQSPGEKNALGKVKFMFPNEHSVYLHDTPDKSLFQKSERAFSSGCIRLESPLLLLEAIERNHAALQPSKLEEILASGKETTLRLKEKIPVHLQYFTVWQDGDSRLHYRNDLYQRDAAILQALDQPLNKKNK